MRNKVNNEQITLINNKILNAIDNKKSVVSSVLKKAFYFKGRKSETIAREIIKVLTKEDDVILDPFFGGGSFILASLEAQRYIEAIELDNYTYDVFKTLLTKMDELKINEYFNIVQENVKDKVMELYKTECCGKPNYIKKLLFDPEDEEFYNPQTNREIKDGKNVILMDRCPICKNNAKKFSDIDKEVLGQTLRLNNDRFPNDSYIENSRINITKSTGADKYDRIFSERNKQAFLIIQDAINGLPDTPEKMIIQHALVVSLALGKISMYGSSTDILYHVINNKGQDMNVWYLFDSNYNSIMKFRREYMNFLVEDVTNNKLMKLIRGSYDDALENIEDKYDLIYTDFPYTDQVPYLERNQLFRKWLEHFVDGEKYALTNDMLEKEIVLTNAPSRTNKNTIDSYYKSIDNMLNILYKVLKENKFMIFTMKLGENRYIRTYSEIINLARKNGFEYVTRIGIEKNDPTLRKQSAYANTFMKEIIVVFKKLPKNNRYWYKGNLNYEYQATKLVYDHILRQKNKLTTLTSAVKLIEKDLISKGFNVSSVDYKIAQRVIENNFIIENGLVYINSNELYLDVEDNTTLFVKLYDLIPLYIKKLLKNKNKFVLEDLYLELTNEFCSGNSNTLTQILEDSGHQNQIAMLIDNYCDIDNGFYVEKKIDNIETSRSEDISQYKGSEFEELIKKLLAKKNFFNIMIVGGAGDRGVDIIASKIINKEVKKYIFQCKRWIGNVGSEPIQRLFAEKEYHKYYKAVCITTSNYTAEGKDALKRFKVVGLNGWDVQKELNKYFPGEYCNKALNIQKK